MNWRREWQVLAAMIAIFLGCFFLPVGAARFQGAIIEALALVKWYAREHVLLCLVPAFFIAGAIAVFISQASVMRYLGPRANKVLAYGVASVSGTILAVCSCTVLPLFAGIHRMGAGLGPATAFLYAGPAINVLAIILTARVLGLELGIARAAGAIVFSVVIGLLMHLIFRKEEAAKDAPEPHSTGGNDEDDARPLWRTAVFFAAMIGVLVFANWGEPTDAAGLWQAVWSAKWPITAGFGMLLAVLLIAWFGLRWWHVALGAAPVVILVIALPQQPLWSFSAGVLALSIITATTPGEPAHWFEASWGFARQILPLLLIGVLIAGFLLGRPGEEGVIPSEWVTRFVGGNSLGANAAASVLGAFMYFATLTEVPILDGLLDSGMGKGPALALLLAGPAVSLPNMLVIAGVIGLRKTLVFILLVIVMSTTSGMIYGALFGG
ncbi:MAG: permease [Planctomycetota bacterium]|nr:permease [Planctomycetota bacterium]